MRKFYFLLFTFSAAFFYSNSSAQVSSYSRTPLSGQAFTPITNGTVINTTAQLSPGQTRNADDGTVLVSLPFSFNYVGLNFNELTVCTNGWLALGNYTNVSLTQSYSKANLFSESLPNYTIAPWYKDGNANFPSPNGNGSIVHGLVDNDVYAIEWRNATGSSYSLTLANTISYMAKLYGPASATPGRIQIIYGNQAGNISTNAAIGIEDGTGGAGHYINALNGLTNSTIYATAWPGNGNGFQFDPPSPCNGAPAGGTTITTAASVCANTPFTVDVSTGSNSSGLVYQWQTSADTVNWTNVTGQNGSNYTVTPGISTAIYFRRITSCGSASSFSSPLMIDVKEPSMCYCAPASGNQLHSLTGNPNIESVSITNTSLSNSTTGAPVGGYTSFSPTANTTAALQQGASYTLNVGLSGNGDASVWIDWNANGVFEAIEWVRAVTSSSGGSVTINVPANAPLGNTGMRIRSRTTGHSNSSTDACLSFGSGETEDYTLSVISAQPCSGTPDAGTAIAPAQACMGNNFTLSTTGFTTASGLSFQWQSSPAGQNTWTNISGATNASASVAQAEVIDYRVMVSCNGGNAAFSNVVTVGMQTANCPAVNDEPCSAIPITISPDGNCVNGIPGTTVSATYSTGLGYSNPISCGGSSSPKDVWFKVQTLASGPGSTALTFRITQPTGSTMKSVNLALFSVIGTCPTLTLTPVPNACNDVGTGWTWTTVHMFPTNLTPNTTYYLRVSTASIFDAPGDFEVCAYIPPQPCTGTPVAGTTTSGTANNAVCASKPFSLSVDNGTIATGVNYQWQRSANGTDWSIISGQTSASYYVSSGISSPVYYRRMMRCGIDSVHSAPVMISLNEIISCYCSLNTGTTLHTTNAAPYINNVSINGTTLNNAHTATAPGSYTQFPASGSTTATLQIGGTYTLTTAFSTAAISALWIDWNRNGNYEVSEWKQIATNSNSGSVLFTVPLNAITRNTGIRIRTRSTGFSNGSSNACTTFSGGETEDYIVTIIPPQPCTGTPAVASINAPMQECAGKNFTLTASGYTVGEGISYQWQSSPAGQNNWSDIAGANHITLTTSQLVATEYKMMTTCNNANSASSNSITVVMLSGACPPVNDEPCNATELILSTDDNCASKLTGTTALATKSTGFGYQNPVGCGFGYSPKDVWYKVTTTASGPGSTSLLLKLAKAPGSTMTTATMTLFAANGMCPRPTLMYVQNACKNSSSGFAPFTMGATNLTPNTTYYLRVNPCADYDPTGTFEICAYLTPATPACVTYVTPTNNAVVPVGQFVKFEWTSSNGAVSYDRYMSTTNPPAFVKNIVGTKDSVKFTTFNTKYYWYVSPKNSGGNTMGCTIDSFMTAGPGANCIPLTSSGCNIGDAIKLFTLNGDNGTAINQSSGCSANAYADYTNSSAVTLSAGSAYGGSFWVSDYKDYASIWIDFNDDGFFTADERLLSNLRAMGTANPTTFTINIPAGAPFGTHRLRMRNVYYGSMPMQGTDACSNYMWGETEDYTVNIVGIIAPTARTVANKLVNACLSVGCLTIDSNSNNNNRFVNIIDDNGNLIAAVNANGNDLGVLDIKVFKNVGAVRTSGNGIKILDRNITLTPDMQPTTPVTLRLYFTQEELLALQNADPTVTGRSSLNATRTEQGCEANGTLPVNGSFEPQQGNGAQGNDHYIELSVDGFSNFYIHGGSEVLPITITSFTGEKHGANNLLKWSTATEVKSAGFELQRSIDGSNFSGLSYVSSKAINGNSNAPLYYEFEDNKPLLGNNYYRLKQLDIDGKASFSKTILIKGVRVGSLVFNNLYPNPAKEKINLTITSAVNDKVIIVITDIAGRVVMQQTTEMIQGDNLIEVDMTNLISGHYLLKLVCSNGCEATVKKFIKE